MPQNDPASPLHTDSHVSNPFKLIRLENGLSQYELARRIGVVKHSILRLEQGMFESPLPSVVNYFVTNFPHTSRAKLLDDYATFQIATRESNARLLGNMPALLKKRPATEHPLSYLRGLADLNPTELAKRLCISQSVVVYFEKRVIHQHSVPEQLITALQDADYTAEETDSFCRAYDKYRSLMVANQGVKITKKSA